MRKIGAIRRMLNLTAAIEKKRAIVCGAIRGRRAIEFYYHGGYRTAEPFCLGVVLEGEADNESLLCYQTGGYSELREVVGWKLYRASEMEDIEVTPARFDGGRHGYDPQGVGMARIICCVIPQKEDEAAEKMLQEKAEVVVVNNAAPAPWTHNDMMQNFRVTHPLPLPDMNSLRLIPGTRYKYLADKSDLESKALEKGCRVPFIRGRIEELRGNEPERLAAGVY